MIQYISIIAVSSVMFSILLARFKPLSGKYIIVFNILCLIGTVGLFATSKVFYFSDLWDLGILLHAFRSYAFETALFTVMGVSILSYILSLCIAALMLVYVRKYSERYAALLRVNKNFKFNSLDCEFLRTQSYTDLYAYKRAATQQYAESLVSTIVQNSPVLWLELKRIADNNRELYAEYTKIYFQLRDKFLGKQKFSIFRKWYESLEDELCSKIIKQPITEIDYFVDIMRVSLRGRKSHKRSFTVNALAYTTLCDVTVQTSSKVVPRLKYQVMLRDEFKCRGCGNDEQLDVYPMHGEDSNLQTWCKNCVDSSVSTLHDTETKPIS